MWDCVLADCCLPKRQGDLQGETTAVENNRILRGWYKAGEGMAMECAVHYLEEGSTRLEMFVRTVLGDRISDLDHRPSTTECLEAYEALHEHFSLFEEALASSMRLDCRAMRRRLRNMAAWNRDSIEPEMYRAIRHMTSGIDADSTFDVDRDMEDIVQRFDRTSVAASPFFRSSLGVVYQIRFCVTANGRMAIVPPNSLRHEGCSDAFPPAAKDSTSLGRVRASGLLFRLWPHGSWMDRCSGRAVSPYLGAFECLKCNRSWRIIAPQLPTMV